MNLSHNYRVQQQQKPLKPFLISILFENNFYVNKFTLITPDKTNKTYQQQQFATTT